MSDGEARGWGVAGGLGPAVLWSGATLATALGVLGEPLAAVPDVLGGTQRGFLPEVEGVRLDLRRNRQDLGVGERWREGSSPLQPEINGFIRREWLRFKLIMI